MQSNNVTINISSATTDDIDTIISILKQNGLIYSDISLDKGNYYIAKDKMEIIGIGGYEQYGNVGLLRSIAVKNGYKSKGYGRAICNELIQIAKKANLEELYLLTTTAENFFKHIGFKEIQRDLTPTEIKNSSQFSSLCPSSAKCLYTKMQKETL